MKVSALTDDPLTAGPHTGYRASTGPSGNAQRSKGTSQELPSGSELWSGHSKETGEGPRGQLALPAWAARPSRRQGRGSGWTGSGRGAARLALGTQDLAPHQGRAELCSEQEAALDWFLSHR